MKSLLMSLVFIIVSFLCTDMSQANTIKYIVVDFSQPSTQDRLYVYQDGHKIYSSPCTHGYGSGHGLYATQFSNRIGSGASSLGTYRITSVYDGHHGLCFRVIGLSSTNYNAAERHIEIHSATYIGMGKTGLSAGCFGVPAQTMAWLLKNVPIGTLLYANN